MRGTFGAAIWVHRRRGLSSLSPSPGVPYPGRQMSFRAMESPNSVLTYTCMCPLALESHPWHIFPSWPLQNYFTSALSLFRVCALFGFMGVCVCARDISSSHSLSRMEQTSSFSLSRQELHAESIRQRACKCQRKAKEKLFFHKLFPRERETTIMAMTLYYVRCARAWGSPLFSLPPLPAVDIYLVVLL